MLCVKDAEALGEFPKVLRVERVFVLFEQGLDLFARIGGDAVGVEGDDLVFHAAFGKETVRMCIIETD